MYKLAGSVLMSTLVTACLVLPVKAEDGDMLSKLTIHGYLNQAFAISDDYQVYGIPDDGTFDYRNAALQFGYDLTDQDRFVLQINHSRRRSFV